MAIIDNLVCPTDDDSELPGIDLDTYFKNLSIDDAREVLDVFTVEQVRQLWENGAFGEGPRTEGFKAYMVERITCGDRLE